MGKAPCCEKIGLKRGKWTVEEDELLVKYIQTNGEGSWRSLPKNAGLLRCGKSCRLRWTNYLRPDLKRGNFTAEEDETIVKLHTSLGNRWSSIAQHLPGRTDNEIKNYWNSNLRRRIYTFRNLKELIKTTGNVPKMVVYADADGEESSRKRDTTIGSKGGSIGSFLPENNIVDDIGSARKTNSSLLCPGNKGDTTLSEEGSIESLLPEDNIVVDRGSTRKNDSSCLGSKDGAMWSEGDSIESLFLKTYTAEIDSLRESNSSCHGGKDDVTWYGGGSIESLLLENIETNSSCPRGMNNATSSEENSIESFLLENYVVGVGSNRETNSSCPGGTDNATWSEEWGSFESLLLENIETNSSRHGGTNNVTWSEERGSFESFLLENIETNSSRHGGTSNASCSEGGSIESFLLESYVVDIGSNRETNSSCLGNRDEAMWSEQGGSIEYSLTENYIVGIDSNRETNFSCPRGKGGAMWSEEGGSIESLLTENYIVDLEFLTHSLPDDIKGLAMQQYVESNIHEPINREEEEKEEDSNNKDIHGMPKQQQQVYNGIWSFEEQEQQIQGPHEQNEENEFVPQQQHNECLYDFANNWCDINFDYFLEEEHGVWTH